MSSSSRAFLERLFRVAVEAVAPETLVAGRLRVGRDGLAVLGTGGREVGLCSLPVTVLGAGKAAARMARGCESALGSEGLSGLVIVADGCDVPLSAVRSLPAGHPLPDRRGLEATDALLERAAQVPSDAAILCLISGGASSLLIKPTPPISLDDIVTLSEQLLASGAAIEEVNSVRKHVSQIKGGGLLRHCSCRVVSLLLSDVIGDDPAVIGSGPTVPDDTTFADAMAVLDRYSLSEQVPGSVLSVLWAGARGELAETLKPDESAAQRASNLVIGSNSLALAAAAEEARRAGWVVEIDPQPIDGDTSDAARRFFRQLQAQAEAVRRDGRGRCLLGGGETTVTVRGSGKGGRNQEFAVALAPLLSGTGATVLSAGSDGIDGPTDVAGAFVDGASLARARARGLSPEDALARNDSYPFLAALGDHFRTGPTGTNVMDFKLAVIEPIA